MWSASLASVQRMRVAAGVCVAVVIGLAVASTAQAQRTNAHYFHSADLPPGAIGSGQLLRGGPMVCYYQPVEVAVPKGVTIAPAVNGQFIPSKPGPLLAGMLIGQVYRLRISTIPELETEEVYPTIEVINRLHPPPGQAARFPIPVQITLDEIKLAISGRFVTRVIYLEDPHTALPLAEDPNTQRYFEVRPGQDPLRVADELGRPMAILRMGSRVPDLQDDQTEFGFPYGTPPLQLYEKPAEVRRDSGLEPTPRDPAASATSTIRRGGQRATLR
jgi:hypothetical protein